MGLYEVKAMKRLAMRYGMAVVALGSLLAGAGMGQEPAAAPAGTQNAPAQAHNNVRRAIEWKQFDYTCEGGEKLTVYLNGPTVKVRYRKHVYLMKQTKSADGNRYSDGKVLWWSKGDCGFLQAESPDGNGQMIAKGCQLKKS